MKVYLDDPITGVREHAMASQAISEGKAGMRFVKMFEEACAKYLGVEDCLATSSGTAALHLGLMIEKGDIESIVIPVCTFPATANVVKYLGIDIALVDVGPYTWTLEKHVDYGLCLPVDLYGNQCLTMWPIVQDGAESMGVLPIRNAMLTMYSFNNNKTITTFGGGLLAGPHEKIKEARYLAYQAQEPESDGYVTLVGYNYRMSHVSAAIGLVQLTRLDEIVDKKRRWNKIYREELGGLIKFQEPTPGTEPSYWFTAGLIQDGTASNTQIVLTGQGVPTRRVFRPLHTMPPYKTDESFPVAEMLWERGLCLPSSAKNNERTIRWVCERVKRILG